MTSTLTQTFWKRPDICSARQSLWWWRHRILNGSIDDTSLERYAMWYAYLEDEREERKIPPKIQKSKERYYPETRKPPTILPDRRPPGFRKHVAISSIGDWKPEPLSWL
jgi:hypothetical protein